MRGFVKGKGTREQILIIRLIIEAAREFYVPVYLCFVDYSKAFDSLSCPKLWDILREMGVPCHLISLLKSLYKNSCGVVRVDNHLFQMHLARVKVSDKDVFCPRSSLTSMGNMWWERSSKVGMAESLWPVWEFLTCDMLMTQHFCQAPKKESSFTEQTWESEWGAQSLYL